MRYTLTVHSCTICVAFSLFLNAYVSAPNFRALIIQTLVRSRYLVQYFLCVAEMIVRNIHINKFILCHQSGLPEFLQSLTENSGFHR